MAIAPIDSWIRPKDESFSIAQGAVQRITEEDLLGDPTSFRGHRFTLFRVHQPVHGRLTPNPDGSFAYHPKAGYLGADSFMYVVQDPQGNTCTETMRIEVVEALPELPPLLVDEYAEVEAGDCVSAHESLLLSLPLEALAQHAVRYGQPAHGALDRADDGTLTYTPEAGFVGEDRFAYAFEDGQGLKILGTVHLSVYPQRAKPTAQAPAISVAEAAPPVTPPWQEPAPSTLPEALAVPALPEPVAAEPDVILPLAQQAEPEPEVLPTLPADAAPFEAVPIEAVPAEAALIAPPPPVTAPPARASRKSAWTPVVVAPVPPLPPEPEDQAPAPELRVQSERPEPIMVQALHTPEPTTPIFDTARLVTDQSAPMPEPVAAMAPQSPMAEEVPRQETVPAAAVAAPAVVSLPVATPAAAPVDLDLDLSDPPPAPPAVVYASPLITAFGLHPEDRSLLPGEHTTEQQLCVHGMAAYGAASAGHRIELFSSSASQLLGTAVVDPQGQWTVDLREMPLADGGRQARFHVRERDGQGQISPWSPAAGLYIDSLPGAGAQFATFTLTVGNGWSYNGTGQHCGSLSTPDGLLGVTATSSDKSFNGVWDRRDSLGAALLKHLSSANTPPSAACGVVGYNGASLEVVFDRPLHHPVLVLEHVFGQIQIEAKDRQGRTVTPTLRSLCGTPGSGRLPLASIQEGRVDGGQYGQGLVVLEGEFASLRLQHTGSAGTWYTVMFGQLAGRVGRSLAAEDGSIVAGAGGGPLSPAQQAADPQATSPGMPAMRALRPHRMATGLRQTS